MKKKNGKGKRVMKYVLVFLLAFAGSAIFKLKYDPSHGKYQKAWNENPGTILTDLEYGDGEANKFDLYLPFDKTKKNYGLVVYLHPGGFTTGDKSGDAEMCKWLASKGYVSASINYTLFSEEHPEANVYTQSMDIRNAMPYVVKAAAENGYSINQMAIAGGSAGGCLALLYAYRDAETAPVPVKMVFEAVGPSSFYPEDWTVYGFDQRTEETDKAAAALFSKMVGRTITPDMIGTPAYDEAIKDASALLWVNENTVPTVMAYGKYDKVQPYLASVRLDKALTEAGVKHEYIVCEHSGHGLQNDNKEYALYMEKVEEYLHTYLSEEK